MAMSARRADHLAPAVKRSKKRARKEKLINCASVPSSKLLLMLVVVTAQIIITRAAEGHPPMRRRSKAKQIPTETWAMTIDQVKRLGQSNGNMLVAEKMARESGYHEFLRAWMDAVGSSKNCRAT